MKSVNLIPAHRVAARRQRVHVRRCAAGCAAWAVLSVIAAGAAHALWRNADAPLADERLAAVNDDIERTERAIATARVQLAAAQSTLRANQAIANQPDWSILLAVLAQGIGDDVVLKSCHVHPVAAPGSAESRRNAAPAAGPAAGSAGGGMVAGEGGPFELEASGVARTLASAHRFVGDLEKTGLFARVTLMDTTRDQYAGKPAIAFRLKCSLDEPAAPAAGGAQAAVDKR